MTLDKKLKNVVIDDLQQVNLFRFENYIAKNGNYLRALHEQGILDDTSIESALETAVFRQARRDYQSMVSNQVYTIYADHVARPDCLAYALDKGEFTQKEIETIPFDGESPKTYSKNYGKENLLLDLKNEILTYNPLKLP